MDGESLKKLTVTQLKVLCKERKITGYSKLQKNAIIKLISTNSRQNQKLHIGHTQDKPHGTEPPTHSVSQEIATSGAPQRTLDGIYPPGTSPLDFQAVAPEILAITPAAVLCHDALTSSPVQTQKAPDKNHLVRCRGTDANLHSSLAKRQKTVPENGVVSSEASSADPNLGSSMPSQVRTSGDAKELVSSCGQDLHTGVIPSSVLVTSARPHSSGNVRERAKKSHDGPKRFVPLILATKTGPPNQQATEKAPSGAQTPSRAPAYLALSLSSQNLSLQLIGLPPSLSQRRRVLAFSVAFSLMSMEDLQTLSLVSRLVRYAAYHSVLWRLQRNCSGDRLTEILRRHSVNTTNFWPYYRFRQAEQQNFSQAINSSILGSHPCQNRISDRLLWNPDNRKQATIAARFLLTHLFFEISVGIINGPSFVVIDAQEVIPREIWTITTRTQHHHDVFYVLEATCEAIGMANNPSSEITSGERGQLTRQPRADWSTYIQEYISSLSLGQPNRPLLAQLKWTNHEEYYQGISKLWLKWVKQEGDLGAAKLIVAERYILACVVGNSISGRWMSSTTMAQEFHGLPARIDPPKQPARKIHLFFPAHHHIESLHFSTPRGQPLHPAIAVVQTPDRVYYILRDNGMQIGCEEDGVAHVWRELLKCTGAGTAE